MQKNDVRPMPIDLDKTIGCWVGLTWSINNSLPALDLQHGSTGGVGNVASMDGRTGVSQIVGGRGETSLGGAMCSSKEQGRGVPSRGGEK